MPEQRVAFIVSDSTGETAYHLLQTVLAQFESRHVRVERYPDITTARQLQAIVEEAARADGLIFHTLVSPGLREAIEYMCARAGIPCVDVLGAPIERAARWLGQQPRYESGMTRRLDESYSRRVMALEFALRHDDGQSLDGLHEADVVLVGVSRTAKSPLSIYLAHHYWLVGNVPIVEEVDPPQVLFELPRDKIVALTVQASRLAVLRSGRSKHLGIAGSYDDPEAVQREVRHALMLYERVSWPVLDMTYRTIEEAADEIAGMLGKRLSAPLEGGVP